MYLCVCGHFQLWENFCWVPAQFYFLESSQQSFHLGVTVIPILQRRRLRLRGVGYLSEITKYVRGHITQSCLTPQHMCLTSAVPSPFQKVHVLLMNLSRLRDLCYSILGYAYWPLPKKKKKMFLSKNIRAFSLLCLTIVCMLYLALLLENLLRGRGSMQFVLEVIGF